MSLETIWEINTPEAKSFILLKSSNDWEQIEIAISFNWLFFHLDILIMFLGVYNE